MSPLRSAMLFCSVEEQFAGAQAAQNLIAFHVVPTYETPDGRMVVMEHDLAAADAFVDAEQGAGTGDRLFRMEPTSEIFLPGGARVEVVAGSAPAQFGPAVRALALAESAVRATVGVEAVVPWIAGARLFANDPRQIEMALQQARREAVLVNRRSAELAGAASYMGSKRELSRFLVECFHAAGAPEETVVFDVMCGSGSAAGGFATEWPVVASDAQEFALVLAQAQGAGLSVPEANAILARVAAAAETHMAVLLDMVDAFVAREHLALHVGDEDAAAGLLASLAAEMPTIARPGHVGAWDPARLVDDRRRDHGAQPRCLFTAYFANVFFGVRQCVEIDSLRYAIDTLDPASKAWALAALVATCTYTATTYGGHFAQPLAPDEVTLRRHIRRVVEKRSLPVAQEFAARLVSLAAESESCPHRVRTVRGPWRAAAESVARERSRPIWMYLDPPYRRDEYSRYYHVLETLMRYDYPPIQSRGLMPPKGPLRFSSEFFTRSPAKMRAALVDVLLEGLSHGWTVAWSYGSSGEASIVDVLEKVSETVPVEVASYSAPHRHVAHGGSRPRTVTEYLIVLRPGGRR